MAFSLSADAQQYFPVAECNDLHLPTGITATFTPEPPAGGCFGCGRYGVEHYGCQRVLVTGTPTVWQREILDIAESRLSRALQYQLYQRAMDLARGVLETDYVLAGGNVSQLYGPYAMTSIGANSVVSSYDSTVDSFDPRNIPGGVRPYGVVRLDGPLGGREWVIDLVDTTGITEDSGGLISGPWTIHTMTPITATALTNAATVVSIYAYTQAALPDNPIIVLPGTGTVTYGDVAFEYPGAFTDPAAIPAQLLRAGPRFCVEQTTAGVPPDDGDQSTYTMIARGLGLDNLAGDRYSAATGAGIESHQHDLWESGWGGAIVNYTDGTTGAARVAYLPGLEVLRKRMDGVTVDFTNLATWPSAGPAASGQLAAHTGYGEAPDAANDPHGRLSLNAISGGTRTAHNYNHGLGAVYRNQPRYTDTQIHFPVTENVTTVQTRHYGTIQWNTFDLDVYVATIYAGLIKVLRPHDYTCTGAFPSFGVRRTAQILAATINEDGTVTLDLAHAGATLLKADGSEIDVALGGGNVALPQHWLTETVPMRCNNPASDQAVNGDGFADRIEAGDCISFNSGDIPEALRDFRLAVVSVEACGGIQAFTNPTPEEGWTNTDDDNWWDSNVASLPGIPGEYLKLADRVIVENENGFIGSFVTVEDLVGLTLPFLADSCMFLPGTVEVSYGNPESVGGDTTISGALIFAAAGMIYLPTALPGECIMVDGSFLAGGRLTSIGNFWGPYVDALRGVMGVRTFVIHPTSLDEDGVYYGLDSYYDDFYYQDPPPANAWKEGTTYYWYSENGGSGADAYIGTRLETASPYNDRYSAITEYYNPMIPFWSADLHRFPWASDAVTGAYAELAVPDLAIEKDLIELQWSETEIEGWNCFPLGTQGLLYCARYTMATDVTATTPLTISLLGVTDDGTTRTYTALAAAGGGDVDAGTTQVYDVTELVKEMMNGRNTYNAFMLFLGVKDYTVTPDKIEGRTFMKTVIGETYKREGSVVDGSFVGTIEATRITYSAAVLTSGVMSCNPDNMPLPD